MILKRNDIMLIAVILIAVIGSFFLSSYLLSGQGAYLLVSVDGTVIKELPLAVDTRIHVETADGEYNEIVIENGSARMEEASCRDQYCVNHAGISANGEVIICLPHKVLLEISGETDATFDGIVR